MAQTPEGVIKAKETMLKKYGVDENGKSLFYKKIGHKGGIAPTTKPKGFAANPRLASKAGKVGGTVSRRGKQKHE